MTRLPRENLAPSICSVITSYTSSFSDRLEAEVPGGQSEGLPPPGEFPEDPGLPGEQVTPPGRQVPECSHHSGIAGRLRPHPSTQGRTR